MLFTTLIFCFLAMLLIFFNYRQGRCVKGLQVSLKQFFMVAPVIVVAFMVAGFLEVLMPAQLVQQWLGAEAGVKGIFLGTLGGMLLVMGPYASFPIIASIYGAGAGLGTTIALITGWSLLGLNRLPYEISFLGVRFFVVRFLISLPFCLAAGAIAHLFETVFFS